MAGRRQGPTARVSQSPPSARGPPILPGHFTFPAAASGASASLYSSISLYFPGWGLKQCRCAQAFLVFFRNFVSNHFFAASSDWKFSVSELPFSPCNHQP